VRTAKLIDEDLSRYLNKKISRLSASARSAIWL